ncbi:DUF4886 domain-containing protein [Sphingobacterium griseoflavum]|uniref:DUF4886 domain-containing protein n=1 Tax=Sphingobacterium griseoflavum TaxID=1474952 RepID=A0ABQ3HY07_9SPHI|nr:DUF4886 domain-containing protein [Sphingobacterium griseoflavum]GHE46016.1 DUF4886 domain-containing protein [Sphingobacterium griseoflavum]
MKKNSFLLPLLLIIQLVFYVQVSAADGVLRILAIGNSFSEDGIENYLHELAAAADKQIIIGNLYIGGAPLSLHAKNVREDRHDYSYRKVLLDGNKKTKNGVSIAEALKDEPWDYISFQQASPLSGNYANIMESLPELVQYVRGQVGPKPAFVYHQTWAYQRDSKHEGFKNYGNDQSTMYGAIAETSKKIKRSGYFQKIIPAGTAIQNARSSSIGDNYTRDGYHLQLDYGRFTAACTWFEKLFGDDVRKNPYKPAAVTELQANVAKRAAHSAVRKPFRLSKIKL